MSELHPRLVKNAIEYGTALLKGDGSHNTVLRLHVEKEIQLHQSTLTTVPEMKHHLDRLLESAVTSQWKDADTLWLVAHAKMFNLKPTLSDADPVWEKIVPFMDGRFPAAVIARQYKSNWMRQGQW